MGSMTITLHGTGAGTPSGHRMASALTARFGDGRVILFDAGEGCSRAMIRDGIDINRVVTVAISHMHADHWCGLPGLITGWGTLGRAGDDVEILVPPGCVEFFESARIESLSFREEMKFGIAWRELAPFDIGGGWSVELFATTHLAKIAHLAERHGACGTAYGYVLRNGDRRIVLSQDIGGAADLSGVIDGAELVVCESAHAESTELLAMARDAGVGRLVFTHVSPRREGTFPERFDGIHWSVASDGMRIDIA
jgi:ribonuclease BN (tRNA processing enzyme)